MRQYLFLGNRKSSKSVASGISGVVVSVAVGSGFQREKSNSVGPKSQIFQRKKNAESEWKRKEIPKRNSDGIQSSSMVVSLFAALIDSAVELEMGDERVLAELPREF
jgi:hypothetical protein